MSAYVVSTDTIDLLVAAADAWRITFPNREGTDAADIHVCSNRDLAGQLLLDENVRSVNYRYDYDEKRNPANSYRYSFVDLDAASVGMPIPVLVLGSVRCLRYQSCETNDYPTTRAALLLDRIEAEACRRLISVHDAPWGFTRDWMNQKRADIKAKIANQLAQR